MPHIPPKDGWPSVTQVTGILDKPFLYRWYGTHGYEECQRLKEESAIAGRKFHEDIEKNLKEYFKWGQKGEQFIDDPFIDAVIRWCEVTGFNPVSYESYVQSENHRYGGTYDCIGRMAKSDRFVLIDWKKTGSISNTHAIQASGYWNAYKESTGHDIQEARIIRPYELKRIAKEDAIEEMAHGFRYSFKGLAVRVEEQRFTNLENYFSVFLNLRETWDYLNNKGMWEK